MPASAAEVGVVLAEAGVTHAFVIGSNHNLGVLDGLQAAGITCVANRCEVGAVHAADGHARVSGERTVVVTSTGPGAGNAVGAFCAAAKDGSPLLHVTTSHFPGGLRAQGVHTTLDQAGWHRAFDAPLLDAAVLDAETIGKELADCAGAATLVVPDNALRACPLPSVTSPRQVEPIGLELAAPVLDEWARTERPLLLIGGGAATVPQAQLVELAERSGAAVVTSIQGKALFPASHPNFAGCTMQSPITKAAIEGATSCLALGSRLTEVTAAAWVGLPPLVVRIGFSGEEPPETGSTYRHLAIDAAKVSSYLIEALPTDAASPFGAESGARSRAARALKGREAREYRLLDAIGAALQPGDVLVCDMTKLAFWALLALEVPEGVHWLWPGMLNMGFGLPAGIGAAVATPDSRVVVLCGDGGLISVAPELDVAARTGGRLSIVMVDDDGYGLLRPFASDQVGSELCTFSGPGWSSLADAFGLSFVDDAEATDITNALDRDGRDASLIRIDGSELCRENWRQA